MLSGSPGVASGGGGIASVRVTITLYSPGSAPSCFLKVMRRKEPSGSVMPLAGWPFPTGTSVTAARSTGAPSSSTRPRTSIVAPPQPASSGANRKIHMKRLCCIGNAHHGKPGLPKTPAPATRRGLCLRQWAQPPFVFLLRPACRLPVVAAAEELIQAMVNRLRYERDGAVDEREVGPLRMPRFEAPGDIIVGHR